MNIFITVFLVLFLSSCGSFPFIGNTSEKIGSGAKKIGEGVAVARVGQAVKNLGEARKLKAQARVDAQKTAQKKNDNETEVRKKEIELKGDQLESEQVTTDAVLKLISKSTNATQTLKLAQLGHSLKKLSIISKTNITIEEERYKFQLEKVKSDNERLIAVAASKYNVYLFSSISAIVGMILMAFLIVVILLIRTVQTKDITLKSST